MSGVMELCLLNIIHASSLDLQKAKEKRSTEGEGRGQCCEALTSSWRGWVSYLRHPVRLPAIALLTVPQVRNAGLGLAFLYMTVLGFDSITWTYCLLQVRPESMRESGSRDENLIKIILKTQNCRFY